MRIWIATIGALLAASAATAWGVEPFAETPQETALCSGYIYGGHDKQFKENTEGKDDWMHMHHYCDCVRYRYRALRKISDKYAYKYDLGVAIGGCDYVLDKTSRGFYMRPKVLVDKGRALRMRGDAGPAARQFQEAIQLNPREVSAYIELAETQKEGGQNAEALKTLYSGLRANPGVKTLEQRYRELGGKEPLPEAVAKPAPDTAEPAPAISSEPPKAEAPSSAATPAAQAPAGPAAAGDGTPAAPTQGCRFCPPDAVQRKWEGSFKGNGS